MHYKSISLASQLLAQRAQPHQHDLPPAPDSGLSPHHQKQIMLPSSYQIPQTSFHITAEATACLAIISVLNSGHAGLRCQPSSTRAFWERSRRTRTSWKMSTCRSRARWLNCSTARVFGVTGSTGCGYKADWWMPRRSWKFRERGAVREDAARIWVEWWFNGGRYLHETWLRSRAGRRRKETKERWR